MSRSPSHPAFGSTGIALVSASLLGITMFAACGRTSLDVRAVSRGAGAASGSSSGTSSAGGGGAISSSSASSSAGTAAGGASGAGGGGTGGAGGGVSATSIVEACVIASSCTKPLGFPDLTASGCVDGFARLGWLYESPGNLPDPELAARLLACATSADCGAVQACVGGDWIGLGRCREDAQCQGNALMAFSGASFACDSLGATCVNLWSNASRACCNAAPCPAESGVTCAGTKVSFCGGWGERVDFDCGPSGRTCAVDPLAICAGAGASCAPMAPISCAGSVATYCSGGALATYDCASTKFRSACAAGQPSSYPPCRPAGSACDPTAEPAGCAGDGVRVCADGEIVVVSCAKLGFAGCQADMTGHARCVL